MKTKIKTILAKIKLFIKTHYIISGVILLVVLFIGWKVFGSGTKAEIFVVKKANVVQKVIVSGKTKPIDEVSLGFETNGKVSRVYAPLGSRVTYGQILVSLNSSEALAELSKAQADLASEESKLNELKRGTRPEEIALAEINVKNAENTLLAKISESFTTSDDAIHNKVDQLFSNPKSTTPQLNLNITDSQLKSDINSMRVEVEALFVSWKNNVDQKVTDQNLQKIKIFVDMVATAVNSQSASGSFSQATLDSYRSAVSVARSNITSVISSLTTAESTFSSAKAELTLKQNGSTPESITAEEAQVMQKKALVQSAQAKLSKMTLYAPFAGVVSRQDAKVGEIVGISNPVVSLISDNNLEIEADVSEISIGKVQVGNKVNITFDAFLGQQFVGVVSSIEPAETLIDGVVNYKITVNFSENYPQLKSGLTSNLQINTASRENVLVVPEYALKRSDAGVFVSKQVGKEFVSTQVQTGLVGQDGFVEVVSGLSEGDTVSTLPAQ